MNCQVFENLVNDLAREQMMEAAVREDAIAHSASCQLCARRLEEERELTQRLREFATAVRDEAISPDIEVRLALEFRSHRASVNTVSHRATRRYWWSAIAAAVALALVSIALSRLDLLNPLIQPPQKVDTPVAKVVQTVDGSHKVDRAADETMAENVVPPPAKTHKKQKRSRRPDVASINNRKTIAANFNDVEVTSEFIPIGYGNTVNVQDGGQLIRVEMPRSAMARFGLPVNMERFDERVKADVLVGVDGLARAIRFVQ